MHSIPYQDGSSCLPPQEAKPPPQGGSARLYKTRSAKNHYGAYPPGFETVPCSSVSTLRRTSSTRRSSRTSATWMSFCHGEAEGTICTANSTDEHWFSSIPFASRRIAGPATPDMSRVAKRCRKPPPEDEGIQHMKQYSVHAVGFG